MITTRLVFVATVVLIMSACTTTREFKSAQYAPPADDYRMIVLEPDVEVGVLTMGGLVEPNEAWTEQATTNVLAALADHQAARGGHTTIALELAEVGGDTERLRDLVALHRAVGQAIFVHKYTPLTLPTKKDRFDWTLGDAAVRFGDESGYDYALFLYAQASFASDARKGLQVAGMLSCALGVCVGVPGGQQIAYASLVDLSSGRISWFNVLSSTVGDIRTPEGASDMVSHLLETLGTAAER